MKGIVIVESEDKAQVIRAKMSDLEVVFVSAPPMKVSFGTQGGEKGKDSLSFEFSPTSTGNVLAEKIRSDPDQEVFIALENDWIGEYWAWMIAGYAASVPGRQADQKRVVLTGMNRQELDEAFLGATTVDEVNGRNFLMVSLFDSCLVRHLNRLINTAAGPGGLPLNFMSLTLLFLLSERESEIRTYSSSMKWRVNVRLSGPGGEFPASLSRVENFSDDGLIDDSQSTKETIKYFQERDITVSAVNRTDAVIPAPSPYRVHGLLRDAFLLEKMSPREVLESLKTLFFGVEINEEQCGLISSYQPYPEGVASGWIDSIKAQVEASYGAEALGDEPGFDSDGEYLLPISPGISDEELEGKLDDNAFKLYRLIRNRAFAAVMTSAEGENIEVEMQAGDCFFQASGRIIDRKGFLKAYQGPGEIELLEPSRLADLSPDDLIACQKILPEKTSLYSAEQYTYESLFGDLLDFSLPADPATILLLQELQDLRYIEVNSQGCLQGLERAATVVGVVNRAFPSMTGINLSAYIQQTVSEVLTGRKLPNAALQQFEQTFMMQGKSLEKTTGGTRSQVPITTRRVMSSGRVLKAPPKKPAQQVEAPPRVEEQGVMPRDAETTVSEGETISPTEDVAPVAAPPEVEASEPTSPGPLEDEEAVIPVEGERPLPQEEDHMDGQQKETSVEDAVIPPPDDEASRTTLVPGQAEDRECQVCGRPMLLKEDGYGKFWACSGAPACRHSESYAAKDATTMNCPVCNTGRVVTKQTPVGKKFFVCLEESCGFMAWSKPHALPCPACNSPFLVEKKNVRGQRVLRCPRAGCNYRQPFNTAGRGDVVTDSPPVKKKVRVRKVKGKGKGKVRRVVVRRK